MGYHRAGFDVVGVDIKPQPHYPFDFWQTDAMEILGEGTELRWMFDAIHASPPCQRYSAGTRVAGTQDLHPDLVAPVRAGLNATGLPWVIENVPGSPLIDPVVLCGTQFGLTGDFYGLRRHRLFETHPRVFALLAPCNHVGPVIGIYGDHGRDRRRPTGTSRGYQLSNEMARTEASAAMQIDWMNWRELSQAIPPAYTEWIGRQLMEVAQIAA